MKFITCVTCFVLLYFVQLSHVCHGEEAKKLLKVFQVRYGSKSCMICGWPDTLHLIRLNSKSTEPTVLYS